MKNTYSLTFIGAGNVAWHLAQAFEVAGHTICEIYSRNAAHAQALADKLGQARPVSALDFSNSEARVFIIAVSDDAIGEVAQNLILPADALLVHTSGSQPMQVLLHEKTNRVGVLYPLQTFSKGKDIDFEQIPICLEANRYTDLGNTKANSRKHQPECTGNQFRKTGEPCIWPRSLPVILPIICGE